MRLEADREQLAGKDMKEGGLRLSKALFRQSPACGRCYSNYTPVNCNCVTNDRRKHDYN
jgi:hypothetical protein